MTKTIIFCFLSLIFSASLLANSRLQVILRLEEHAKWLKMSPSGHYITWSEDAQIGFNLMDLRTREIISYSNEYLIGENSWSEKQDTFLYYKRNKQPQEETQLVYLDPVLNKREVLNVVGSTSQFYLPIMCDERAWFIASDKLVPVDLPEGWLSEFKLGPCQKGWIATVDGIFERDPLGHLTKLWGGKIATWSSADEGKKLVWQTENEEIFVIDGEPKIKFISFGRHPSWVRFHGNVDIILVGRHMVSGQKQNYDVSLYNLQTSTNQWLTKSYEVAEEWPALFMYEGEKVIFSKEGSTDVFSQGW